jgi:hypothetical protein
MKASNNVNGVGAGPKEEAYTVDGGGELLALQEDMTRKVVSELRAFDNLFYEVMNEPYHCDVPMAWQHRIVDVIVATEVDAAADGKGRHLISLNVANRQAEVRDHHPAVSIFNFHYAWPPDTAPLNYGLGLPIGDNETGFTGQEDFPYRRRGVGLPPRRRCSLQPPRLILCCGLRGWHVRLPGDTTRGWFGGAAPTTAHPARVCPYGTPGAGSSRWSAAGAGGVRPRRAGSPVCGLRVKGGTGRARCPGGHRTVAPVAGRPVSGAVGGHGYGGGPVGRRSGVRRRAAAAVLGLCGGRGTGAGRSRLAEKR